MVFGSNHLEMGGSNTGRTDIGVLWFWGLLDVNGNLGVLARTFLNHGARRILGIYGSFALQIDRKNSRTGVREQIGRRRDRRRLPQIGRSVDIGGRSLNIFCAGTGSPAVILDTGGDNPGLAWEDTRSEIAKFTQACWFDRAGIGWSDSGPYPRTSAAMSSDLHELLGRAGIPPPYVVAGGSIGGLNARVFASMYPKDTAGVVLDDAAHEDEPLRAPHKSRGAQSKPGACSFLNAA